MNAIISQAGNDYRDYGLNVLPAWRETKRPSTSSWARYQTEQYKGAFKTDALCIVCGKISGNLETIDFDMAGRSFESWKEEVLKNDGYQDVLDTLVIEKTQSGGYHVGYRSEFIEPTQKLCLIKKGNTYVSSIETRSEGSVILVSPSSGYELIQGKWTEPPTLPKEVRDVLINSARNLTEAEIKPRLRNTKRVLTDSTNSNDVAQFLREDDTSRRVLLQHGWTCVGDYKDNKEVWRRPGKRQGISATLDKETGLVYVFTSNAYPLMSNTTYTPLQLLATMEFNGCESEAAKSVIRASANNDNQIYKCPISIRSESFIKSLDPPEVKNEKEYTSVYDVPFPDLCLNPGGYLQEVVDYTDRISTRKQPRLAFAAAFTSLGHLMSRRVIFEHSNITPCIYTIGISPPSSGKSFGRVANQTIFHLDETGTSSYEIIEQVESVQALQNSVQAYKKCFLMQDEFGDWLTSIVRERGNGNKTRIIGEMLKLFSESSNPAYVPRVTASTFNKGSQPIPVEYPSFSLYGVTNFAEFQSALSERLLGNGFIARVLFVVGDNVSPIYLPEYENLGKRDSRTPPETIQKMFKEYLQFRPTDALKNRIPNLFPIGIDRDAYDLIRAYSLEKDKEYLDLNEIEAFDLKTLKGRTYEKTIKYSLIFACSKFGTNEKMLRIDKSVAEQAMALSIYEHDLYEYLTKTEIAASESEGLIKNVEKWLRTLKKDTFTKSAFTRRFQRLTSQERVQVLMTLEDKGTIQPELVKGDGASRAKTIYNIDRSLL